MVAESSTGSVISRRNGYLQPESEGLTSWVLTN